MSKVKSLGLKKLLKDLGGAFAGGHLGRFILDYPETCLKDRLVMRLMY
ncbi:MAG: hypothetical protein HFP76_04975 [Methylococcales symbiont of Iophon sp. n. MRB-2018]|nr:MAG: hypothetical protein HFP76_04975 [Methylococcales symbiont of Iophon sp. n. MRB-2018]